MDRVYTENLPHQEAAPSNMLHCSMQPAPEPKGVQQHPLSAVNEQISTAEGRC